MERKIIAINRRTTDRWKDDIIPIPGQYVGMERPRPNNGTKYPTQCSIFIKDGYKIDFAEHMVPENGGFGNIIDIKATWVHCS